MGLYVLTCIDDEAAAGVRDLVRPTHLEYVAQHQSIIRIAGPVVGKDGAPAGSLYILEAEDADQVEAFTRNDPFHQAGLFKRIDIVPWKVTVNRLFEKN